MYNYMELNNLEYEVNNININLSKNRSSLWLMTLIVKIK